jgi:hypothetical protein
VSDLKSGEVRLYQRFEPRLKAGSYAFELDQEVKDGATPLFKTATTRFHFEVTAPRLALQPADVIGVFPAPGERQASSLRLPHIALRRRTLPWEWGVPPWAARDVSASAANRLPWFMLLLFEVDEVTLRQGVSPDWLALGGQDAGARCTVVDVPESLLKKVLPLPEELSYLAHVREVSLADKEAGDDEDGYLAVVIGNRLPRPGVEHIACLVSLEGVWTKPFWPTLADTHASSGGGGGGRFDFGIFENEVFVLDLPPDLVPGGGRVPDDPRDPFRDPGEVLFGGPGRGGPRFGSGDIEPLPQNAMVVPAGVVLEGPDGARVEGPATVAVTSGAGVAARTVRAADGTVLQGAVRQVLTHSPQGFAAIAPRRLTLHKKRGASAVPKAAGLSAAVSALADRVRVERPDHFLVDSAIQFNDPLRPLVVLHSWRFTTGSDGDFEQRMQTLHQRGGVGLVGAPAPGAAAVVDASGHATLDHRGARGRRRPEPLPGPARAAARPAHEGRRGAARGRRRPRSGRQRPQRVLCRGVRAGAALGARQPRGAGVARGAPQEAVPASAQRVAHPARAGAHPLPCRGVARAAVTPRQHHSK